MDRVVILGPGGAGKSALARAVSARTGIPVTHLDVLFWAPGWQPASPEVAVGRLAATVATRRWIIDGNFLRYADRDGRFQRVDTVIFLDLPRATCLWRVMLRLARDRHRRRPDLPEGCAEGFDPDGMRRIWRYRRDERPGVLELLGGLDHRVSVHRLRTRSDVRRYLASIPPAR